MKNLQRPQVNTNIRDKENREMRRKVESRNPWLFSYVVFYLVLPNIGVAWRNPFASSLCSPYLWAASHQPAPWRRPPADFTWAGCLSTSFILWRPTNERIWKIKLKTERNRNLVKLKHSNISITVAAGLGFYRRRLTSILASDSLSHSDVPIENERIWKRRN